MQPRRASSLRGRRCSVALRAERARSHPSAHLDRLARSNSPCRLSGRFRRGEAVLNAELSAELVELVLPCRSALTEAEDAIGELFSKVCTDRANADRAGTLQVSRGKRRAFAAVFGLKIHMIEPACRHRFETAGEAIVSRGRWPRIGRAATSRWPSGTDTSRRCGHSRAHKSLSRLARPRCLGLRGTQVADATPAKAEVEPQARDLRVQ